jgi:MbtH protein
MRQTGKPIYCAERLDPGRGITDLPCNITGESEVADENDDRTYIVVRNDEEQHSIWLTDREVPNGWRPTGFLGPKQECLNHIAEVWTDMRPLTLRMSMEDPERDRSP